MIRLFQQQHFDVKVQIEFKKSNCFCHEMFDFEK